MLSILGHLLGAIGIFFVGTRILTEHLKALSNRRLRRSALRWTGNRYMGFAWGLIAGSVMQSMTVVTLVVISMLKSDLVSPKRAFSILLGGNTGVALLVLIVTLDVKVVALYVLGIAYLLTLLTRGRTSRYQVLGTACFGLGMIVLGSIMLKESVVPLSAYPWFQQTLDWVGDSLVLPLLTGVVLTCVVQSAVPIIVAGIGMATVGALTIEQVLMLNCGSCLGSSLILYVLTMAETGRARQVAMYQVLFNAVLNAIFVPLICIEAYWDIPLVAAAVRDSDMPLGQGLAVCVIVFEVITVAVQLSGLGLAAHLIQRGWPPTEVEKSAKPRFIHDHALGDVGTALRRVDLEQRRLLEMLSRYLDTVRRGTRLNELRGSTRDLRDRIKEFLDDLAERCPEREADVHNALMTRQKLFAWLEEQVTELCGVLHALPPKSSLDAWSVALIEGIDIVLLVLIDTLASDDAAAWPSTTQLVSDRSRVLRKRRDMSLKNEATLTADERTQVLNLAGIAENIFLLMERLTHEYRRASRIDEAFLDHADLEDLASVTTAHPNARETTLSL